jgi:hypothetical protein
MTFFETFAALAGFAVLSGCHTETGTLRVDSEVAQSSTALTGPEGGTLVLDNGRLTVSRARVAVSEIEFEGGDEDDEREAELGAAVIDLDLDGSLTRVTANSVEAGSYHTLGLELAAGGLGASILVDGTYDGNAFTFRSALNPELEFPLRPEVAVPANGEAAVGVMFDVAAWFTAGDGSAVNPTDGANQSAIESKILASMAAHAAIEQGDSD